VTRWLPFGPSPEPSQDGIEIIIHQAITHEEDHTLPENGLKHVRPLRVRIHRAVVLLAGEDPGGTIQTGPMHLQEHVAPVTDIAGGARHRLPLATERTL
jgi:hypothetical protein